MGAGWAERAAVEPLVKKRLAVSAGCATLFVTLCLLVWHAPEKVRSGSVHIRDSLYACCSRFRRHERFLGGFRDLLLRQSY